MSTAPGSAPTSPGGAARERAPEPGAPASGERPSTAEQAHAERRARAAHWAAEAERARARSRALSNARLAVFVVGLLGSLWLLKTHVTLWPLLAVPVGAFTLLVVLHHRADRAADRADAARAAADFRLARREARWDALPPPAQARDLPEPHLFAHDLDLDRAGSLLALLGAPAEPTRRPSALLRWLTEPPELHAARARQAAVAELAGHAALLEDAAALSAGDHGRERRADEPAPGEQLLAWARRPAAPPAGWEWAAAALLAPAGVAAAVHWAGFGGSLLPLVLVGVLDALVDQIAAARRRASSGDARLPLPALARVRELLRRLHALPASSAALRELQATLVSTERERTPAPDAVPAHAALAELEARLDALEAGRRNPFAFVVVLLLRLELPRRRALEAWRARWSGRVDAWLATADAFEGLLALAAYRRDHPEDAEPELLEGPPRVEAEGLAHPLLAQNAAVRNDVSVGGDTQLLVVSGSNMSGKSTLLRALGCNLALAFAGAPVRATRLAATPLQLGASLRARDSLLDGRSRFFAEIERLERIERATAGPLPVLALLDELLAGTNSSDRLEGARALLAHLRRRGALVVLTTHDLALTRLAEEPGAGACNVHFRDELRDGRPHFDHRLRPGVVPRGNGLELMRSLGLPV